MDNGHYWTQFVIDNVLYTQMVTFLAITLISSAQGCQSSQVVRVSIAPLHQFQELSHCASLSTQHVRLSGVPLCRPDSLELAV